MIVKELFAKLGLEVDEGAFSAGEAAIELLKDGLIAAGATAAAAALAIVGTVKATADAGAAASRTAQKVGTSAQAWQELKFASEAATGSSEALEMGLGFLARSAYAAAHGSAEAQAAYRALGVSVKGADGKIRASDELLADIAEKFAKMPDSAEKTALAMHLFGRGGKELIPFLNKGRDGIEALREEAIALGVVLDEKTIAAAKHFKKATHEVEAAATGVAYAIGGPLIESFTPMLEALAEWIKDNRALIAQRVHDAINATVDAVKMLGKFLAPIGTMLKWIASNTALLKIAMVILGGYLTLLVGSKIIAAISLVGDLVTAIRAVGVASSITAAIGAAAPYLIAAAWLALGVLIFLVLEDIYQFATGGQSIIGEFWEWLKASAPKAWAAVTEYLSSIFSTAVDFWKTTFTTFWDWLVDKVTGFGKLVANEFSGGVKSLIGVMPGGDYLNRQIFGDAGSSPAASVSSKTTSVGGASMNVGDINVSVQGTADGADVGAGVVKAIDDERDAWLREAAAGVAGG